jgi:hypothetical protein
MVWLKNCSLSFKQQSLHYYDICWVRIMVFNATFNNISVISWQSVLLTELAGENHPHVVSYCQTLSHNVVSSTPRHEQGSNSQL